MFKINILNNWKKYYNSALDFYKKMPEVDGIIKNFNEFDKSLFSELAPSVN